MNKFRIVVVEDNPGDVELLHEAFLEADLECDVHLCSDGEGALHYLAQLSSSGECPDLFILDVNLPRVDGLSVLQALKSDPRIAPCPVLVMTSSASLREQAQVNAYPGTALLLKPNSLDSFLQIGKQIKAYLQTGVAEPGS